MTENARVWRTCLRSACCRGTGSARFPAVSLNFTLGQRRRRRRELALIAVISELARIVRARNVSQRPNHHGLSRRTPLSAGHSSEDPSRACGLKIASRMDGWELRMECTSRNEVPIEIGSFRDIRFSLLILDLTFPGRLFRL